MSTSSLPLRPKTLITFDIDGTLCKSDAKNSALANAMHTKAFSHAFKEVFGIDASIDEVSHHGSTDQLILLKGIVAFCFSALNEHRLSKVS
jgi:FMN phosphatase YigB (HAD superfamily)